MPYNKNMNKQEAEHIEVDPDVLVGKPVIKNTRVPVSLILNLLGHGYSIERIVEAYPILTAKDVQAALEYAEGILDREEVMEVGRIAHAT